MVSVSWARSPGATRSTTAGRFQTALDYGPQNPFNWTSNYGNSNFDVRRRLSLSYIYELPFGRGKALVNQPGIARAVLGGWQLSGVTCVSDRTAVHAHSELRSDQYRHHRAPQCSCRARRSIPVRARPIGLIARLLSLRPHTLTATPAATFCAARTPSIATSDCCAPATFKERYTLQFSAQAFNVFNTPQFGLPNNTVGVATTGVITTVVTPERQLQLGLHLHVLSTETEQ